MGRALATLLGVLILAGVAAGLTEASLAYGRTGGLADDAKLRPAVVPKPHKASPKVTPSPTVSVTPSASAAPKATPTPVVAAGPTATTNSFVHMRAARSTSSAIVVDLNAGTVVSLQPGADSQWQPVQYGGQTGYVFRTYLTY